MYRCVLSLGTRETGTAADGVPRKNAKQSQCYSQNSDSIKQPVSDSNDNNKHNSLDTFFMC